MTKASPLPYQPRVGSPVHVHVCARSTSKRIAISISREICGCDSDAFFFSSLIKRGENEAKMERKSAQFELSESWRVNERMRWGEIRRDVRKSGKFYFFIYFLLLLIIVFVQVYRGNCFFLAFSNISYKRTVQLEEKQQQNTRWKRDFFYILNAVSFSLEKWLD